MTRAPTYATRRFTIPAGGDVQIARAADFLTCLSATGAFRVSFDNAPATDFEAGLTYNTETGFQRVQIINESAAELVVNLGFGRGDIKDSRLTLSGQVDTRPQTPDTMSAGNIYRAASPWTEEFAANPNRKEIIIQCVGGSLWISGKAEAALWHGVKLETGQSLTLETTAAVWVAGEGNLNWLETEFSA